MQLSPCCLYYTVNKSYHTWFPCWWEGADASDVCSASGSRSIGLGYWVSGTDLFGLKTASCSQPVYVGNWYLEQRAARISMIFKINTKTLKALNYIYMQVCFGRELQHLIFAQKFWSAWPVLMQCKCGLTCGTCRVWRWGFDTLVYPGHFSVVFTLNQILGEAESKSPIACFRYRTRLFAPVTIVCTAEAPGTSAVPSMLSLVLKSLESRLSKTEEGKNCLPNGICL